MNAHNPNVAARFWAKVDTDGPGGCWLWTAHIKQNGYGVLALMTRPQKNAYAHRLAYELLVGPIPEGLQIDHLCRVRHCVNPAHLEPVTPRENLLRGETVTARNAVKTHCKWGHPYSEENTYIHRGSRYCRACDAAKHRRRQAARRKPRYCRGCGAEIPPRIGRGTGGRVWCNGCQPDPRYRKDA